MAKKGKPGDSLSVMAKEIDAAFAKKKPATNSKKKFVSSSLGGGVVSKRMSDIPDACSNEWVSTGSMFINNVIGHPGIPIGHVVALIGQSGSGKTTQLVHFMREAQRKSYITAYIDGEKKFDPARSRAMGLDNKKVLYYDQVTLEQMFGLVLKFCHMSMLKKPEDRIPTLICVDSHSSLLTGKEHAQDVAELDRKKFIAESASTSSLGLARIKPLLWDAKITVVLVCQPTQNIGSPFNSDTYKSKRKIDHYSILRLKYSRIGKLDGAEGDPPIGSKVKVRLEDSRISPPLRECVINCMNSTGFDDSEALLDFCVDHGIVTVGGGWFRLAKDPDKPFRRKEFLVMYEANEELRKEIESKMNGDKV